MKLILKYLKPYALTVLIIVGLTFVQVQAELALPDYMSSIVSGGIQYGGIEENIPVSVTEKDMDRLKGLLSESDYEKVLSSYHLINKDTKATVRKQEISFNENVYLINETYDENLGEVMEEALVFLYIADESGIALNDRDALKKASLEIEDSYSNVVKLSIKDVYDRVGLSTSVIQSNYILHDGLVMLGISFVAILVQILGTYLSTRTAASISASMRRAVFEKVESFSSTEFSKFSTSSLITRTGNDIVKIQQLIQMMLRMMLMAPMMGITAVFKVVRYPSISWLLLVAIGVMLGTLIILLVVAVPKFEVLQKLTDKINSVMREFLDGMLVIRAFNSQKHEEKRFDDTNSALKKLDTFVSSVMSIIFPMMTIIMNYLTVFIIWFASRQIDMNIMSVGDMMAFLQYAMHVVMSFMFVSMLFFMIPRSLVSAKRISEVLDTENSIFDKEETVALPEENGTLKFENVSFKYPGAEEYVLSDVSFEAKPGETVALIGSTGSGKSTVVKLIPRLFDVTEGRITYCDIDIRDVKQAELHERIGFATQKAVLFKGTIRSNIEFGRKISEEEINQAIDISQSREILKEKEGGLDSEITQGGTNVSGGQKQRLSIARALAKNESIYIFDDAFSALDYQTDKTLRSELNKLIEKTKATVIIVAQRIATIKNADKIIVLDAGKIVGIGSHRELLDTCKVYQEIAYSQLSKEELEHAAA